MKPQTGPAKLYPVKHPDSPFLVVYRDPTRRENNGRAKRVQKWFSDRAAAATYRDQLNETLLRDGAAGIGFDAVLRADAIAARRWLDAKGHAGVTLRGLAERFTSQVANHATMSLPIAPEVTAFLDEKEHVDGAAVETVKNLKTRLWMWINLARITILGDITRDAAEALRTRPVAPQTRRNDLSAASDFCTWLVDQRKLDHHPIKGLKRPKVQHGKKPTFTADECDRVLKQSGARQPTLAVMILAGPRPSELTETRLIYGRHPMVRVEGGKLRGRANRMVPMSTALRAFLATNGNPEQVAPLTRKEREQIGRAAGVKWKPDICRHTYISNRLQLAQDDKLVAREAGTSEDIIYRHYHGLKTPAEARRWAGLRPAKSADLALTPAMPPTTVIM